MTQLPIMNDYFFNVLSLFLAPPFLHPSNNPNCVKNELKKLGLIKCRYQNGVFLTFFVLISNIFSYIRTKLLLLAKKNWKLCHEMRQLYFTFATEIEN